MSVQQEKPALELRFLILASAQLDHLSCFYDKLVNAWIWLEALSKLCIALSAVIYFCSHQINFSFGWLLPCFRLVLISVVFLLIATQFFSRTLTCSNKITSRFSSFSHSIISIPIKLFTLLFHNGVLSFKSLTSW